MSRKLAREIAMKASYAQALGGGGDYSSLLEQTSEHREKQGREPESQLAEDIEFAEDILLGINQNEAELDEWIAKYAIGWALERMPKVDLCILRIAVYEMLYREDISHSVSINEAVELAKHFSGDKSPAFINGILGSVSQALNGEKT